MKSQKTVVKDTVEILIVEDSPTQAEQLKYLLEAHDYKVTVASHGGEGFEAACQRKPTLIISDIMMPVMDGYLLCKEIKADKRLKDTPVVLMTSLSSANDIIRGLFCGADSFIRKPYDEGSLLSRIEYILANRKLRQGGRVQIGLEIHIAGERHFITAERQQMLDLLISTYEEAVCLNQVLDAQQKDLVRSQEALRNQTTLLQSILDSIGDGVVVVDEQGKFLQFNPAAEHILGIGLIDATPEQWVEQYGFYLPDTTTPYPAQELPLVRALHRQAVDEAEVFVRNWKRPEGVWLSVNARPLKGERGVPRGGVIIFRDITERKRAEEEIRKLNDELERRIRALTALNQELEAFSYSVSHDLRAPLRHIDGFVDLLQENAAAALDEKNRRYLRVISESAKHMGNLIDDLLVFSRMGRADMLKTRVCLERLVKEALDGSQADMTGRNVAWTIGPLPEVQGDPSMLRLVLVNLISNALKYTRPRAEARIEIGCASDQSHEVVFFVRDNGVGFDMTYADKLFGVFQRLHPASEFEGTGIGLANVRRIIHRHGGRTWAEGSVDGGATFYFSLPKSS